MDFTDLDSNATKCVNLRLCNVSGYVMFIKILFYFLLILKRFHIDACSLLCSCMTEILEIRADRPSFHVVFIPGNPGMFYCL